MGDPCIDELDVLNKKIPLSIKKQIKINNHQKYILLALSGPGHCTSYNHFNEIVDSILEFSENNNDYIIVAKLHRKDNKKNYQKIKNKYPSNNLYIFEDGTKDMPSNIFDWLRNARLVITGASTVALESMLMKIPVITIDYMDEYKNIDFIDCGATKHVKDRIHLSRAIHDTLKSSEKILYNADKYINSYYYNINKCSAKLIAEYLSSDKVKC